MRCHCRATADDTWKLGTPLTVEFVHVLAAAIAIRVAMQVEISHVYLPRILTPHIRSRINRVAITAFHKPIPAAHPLRAEHLPHLDG